MRVFCPGDFVQWVLFWDGGFLSGGGGLCPRTVTHNCASFRLCRPLLIAGLVIVFSESLTYGEFKADDRTKIQTIVHLQVVNVACQGFCPNVSSVRKKC